jgi:hypothetical protein
VEPQLESEGLESQIVGPRYDLEDHFDQGELSHSSPKSKEKLHIFSRYVRRHHAPEKIIGDHSKDTMKRNKLKGTCFLIEFEPRTIKYALDNEIWIESMNEEIEKIEKN